MAIRQWTLYSSGSLGNDLALVDKDGNKIEGIIDLTLRGSRDEPMRLEIEIMPKGINVEAIITDVDFLCPACGDTVRHECERTLGG